MTWSAARLCPPAGRPCHVRFGSACCAARQRKTLAFTDGYDWLRRQLIRSGDHADSLGRPFEGKASRNPGDQALKLAAKRRARAEDRRVHVVTSVQEENQVD